MLPPPPAHHPGFGTLSLPELLVIFAVVIIIYGFFQLRR
jgi:hypothetical protein